MENKVIFLDFDGVISVLETRWELSDRHMKRVKRICDSTGAKIVITSSWRWGDVDTTLEKIYKRAAKEPTSAFVDKNHYLLNKDLVVGVTKRIGAGSRGIEIKNWLGSHPEVTRYLILDDDSFDILPKQKDFLIQTDWAAGIEDEEVEKAIQILNN